VASTDWTNIDSPIVTEVIKEMRTTYKVKKIGAAGYCFGGKVCVHNYASHTIQPSRHCIPLPAIPPSCPNQLTHTPQYVARYLGAVGKENNASVDAGFTAHPSFVEAAELKAITGPLSIAAAETDQIFPADKRHESEVILKELSDGPLKVPYQLNLYSGVQHGFAVRADLEDKRAKFAKEQAFIQAVQWFDYFLKDGAGK